MIEFVAERVIAARPRDVWALATDPTRFPEWLDGVEAASAAGEPGRGQTHLVSGPWGEQRFEIERVVEHWEPPRLARWRDTAELLDGKAPADMWHRGSWLAVELRLDADGTLVRLEGRQEPASEAWEERLFLSVPAIEARLATSLENLARALGAAEPPK